MTSRFMSDKALTMMPSQPQTEPKVSLIACHMMHPYDVPLWGWYTQGYGFGKLGSIGSFDHEGH
jgi:hypothetical protein